MTRLKPGDLPIVAFNLAPLAGVWLFDWRSFDLIFLYWMENVVIGVFTVLRMVVRRYFSSIDAAVPLLLAPFFCVHYGLFCFVHGMFIVSLFGDGEFASKDLVEAVTMVLGEPGMAIALLSLVALQAFDWFQDIARTVTTRDLMLAPYRRIVVLHLVIIGSGFALTALGDPRIGLVALVVIKTFSDLYHAHRSAETDLDRTGRLSAQQLDQLKAEFAEPIVKVNGREKRFASFAELKASKEFRMLRSLMHLLGSGDRLLSIESLIDQKIDEERGLQPPAKPGKD